jgi:Tfp pilus assembly protein PilZ
MGDKRRHRRYSKRLKVEWGEQDFSNTAFTNNISKSGAFVISGKLPKIGQNVHIKITGEAGRWFACEGVVKWAKEVPPALRQIQRSGYGVRFMLPDELVESLIPHIRSEKRFEVLYQTAEDLQRAFNQELKHGGVFVPTKTPVALHEEVTVDIVLEFARHTIEAAGRVMQIMGGEAAGSAISFTEKEEILRMLQGHLPPADAS